MEKNIKGLQPSQVSLNGKELKVLIVHTRWNVEVVSKLVNGAIESLTNQHEVQKENITIKQVPGAYELPFACKRLIASGKYDAVIAIGVLIKGSTMHFEYICEAVAQGLCRVGLDTGVPVIFGVLTCLTEEQALQRAGELGGHNHGLDWGSAAVEMALLKAD